MAAMNIYVDGTALDNGSSRKIYGQFQVQEVTGVGISVTAAVFLEAATTDALQELWESTKELFQKKDATVIVTLDSAVDTPLEYISPLDGKHDDVITSIEISAGKDNTDTSMWCVFTCTASSNEADADGQLGDILCTTTYDSARIVSIEASGVFTTTFDESATTGLTINSVSNSGGKAVFNVASGAPTYVEGMRIKVSGTTNYQSPSEWHKVTGITGNAITTDTDFAGTDTGTLDVGEATSGLANYQAQKSTILTSCLTTDSDGSRNSSSEMALTGESIQVNDDDNIAIFSLQADWMEVEISAAGAGAAARTFNLKLSTTQPDAWQSSVGGARPLLIEVIGSVTFDRDALGRAVKDSDWNTIASKVESEVRSKSGQSDAKRLNLTVDTSGQDNTISFSASYLAINTEHFTYQSIENEVSTLNFQEWRDADGFHTFQKAPGPDDVMYSISINRSGPSLINIEPPAPQFTLDGDPALFINVSKQQGKQGQIEYDEFNDVWLQKGTWTFKKVDLRPGAAIGDLKLGVE